MRLPVSSRSRSKVSQQPLSGIRREYASFHTPVLRQHQRFERLVLVGLHEAHPALPLSHNCAAFIGLVLYEHLLTLNDECNLVLRRRWTAVTWLFLINRYMMFLMAAECIALWAPVVGLGSSQPMQLKDQCCSLSSFLTYNRRELSLFCFRV